MDRRVKERLIGASILVALIVLVVPELLSGPKRAAQSAPQPAIAPEPTRHVTVDLTTSKAPANAEAEPAQGSPASPDSTASPGAAASAASTPGTVRGAEALPAPAPAAPSAPAMSAPAVSAPAVSAPVETTASFPISARAAWAVQLGSFAKRENADNLTRQLKGQGFPVYVLPGGSGTSVRYRVRVGPLANRDAADRTAAKLKSIGHDSSLVAPAG
jgi:DedD protein